MIKTYRNEQILELIKNPKYSLTDIAKKFGISKQRVSQIGQRMGYEKCFYRKKTWKEKLSEEQLKEIKEMREGGMKWADISKVFGKQVFIKEFKKYGNNKNKSIDK